MANTTTETAKPLPPFFVGKAVTDARKAIFKEQKAPELKAKLGREDTKSVWYSKEHIASLLDEITHANGDGLRIYFGAYEDTHLYAGQTCLLMNCTQPRVNNGVVTHTDVYLEDADDFAERSGLERGIRGDAEQVRRPRDFNFGSPCPPRCEEGETPE